MHRTARTALVVAAVAVAGHAVPAAGQDAALRELVEAVVGGEMVVGALPPDSPVAGAIPEDARILGAVVQPWGSAVVLGMRGETGLVEGRVRDALRAGGWTVPVVEMERSGFVAESRASSSLLCRDDVHLSLSVTPGEAGESLVRLSLNRQRGGRSPCEVVRRSPGDSWIPELLLPPGVQMVGGGSSRSSDDVQEAQANLDTTMGVIDLAGHFARQAERQGWEPTTEREDAVVALRTFTKVADDGRRLHGMLLILAPPGVGGRMATFRVAPLTGTAR